MQCQSQGPYTENRFCSNQEKTTRFIRNYCTHKNDLSEKYCEGKYVYPLLQYKRGKWEWTSNQSENIFWTLTSVLEKKWLENHEIYYTGAAEHLWFTHDAPLLGWRLEVPLHCMYHATMNSLNEKKTSKGAWKKNSCETSIVPFESETSFKNV